MWIAALIGGVTVLFYVENESSVSWLKEKHESGNTREEAINNLKVRLLHEQD
ncbi:MAG: hypothetical protein HXS47_02665 [Theionarchaea archaeon]|nr:hypothetical protein [Theionarchaea archaeon]